MKQPEDGGEAGAATTNTGTVMTWFENMGFGFITHDDGGVAVCIRRTQLIGSQELKLGDTVSYPTEYEYGKRRNRRGTRRSTVSSQPANQRQVHHAETGSGQSQGLTDGSLWRAMGAGEWQAFFSVSNPRVRVKRFPRL